MASVLTTVIVNPRAAAGRVGREWAALEPALKAELGDVQFLKTEKIEDGIRLAEQAVRGGSERVLSLGGDGTHNEVLNGILRAGVAPGSVTLGILPAGTGGDFRRLLNSGQELLTAARAIPAASATLVDAGQAWFKGDDGVEQSRYFLNILSFGIGGLVCRLVNKSSKRLGGRVSFFVATLEALMQYTPAKLRLVVDGDDKGVFEVTNIAVCNGRYFGGGMMVGPMARLADGVLEVMVLRAGPLPQVIGLSRTIYQGKHLASPLVSHFSGREIVATPVDQNPAWIDCDGEAPGVAPVRISVVPGAVKLLDLRPEVA